MSYLNDMINQIEKSVYGAADIDVFMRTHDSTGDGYAFVFMDEPGQFDVNYLQDRIPTNSWHTDTGMNKIQEIFEAGRQSWSKANSLLEAVNQVFDYWMIPECKKELYSIELVDAHTIRLILAAKAKE